MTAEPRAVPLACGEASASVSARGAECTRWCVDGREMLWPGDARWWPRHSPLLFPIVGHLEGGQARFGDALTALPVHGFAASLPFAVVAQAAHEAVFEARSSADTRAAYPFDFTLRVRHRLAPQALSTEVEVVNDGGAPMPYALGLHPGFRWPFAGGAPQAYRVRFEAAEAPQVPVITPQGLFTRHTRAVPLQGRLLALAPELFADEALCFLHARSRSLAFEAPDGAAIELAAEGFAHWALWSPAGAPLLSIECWSGHGDFAGEPRPFAQRPSTRTLAPGARAVYRLDLRYRPGALA